jgi:hypothetical protein
MEPIRGIAAVVVTAAAVTLESGDLVFGVWRKQKSR